METQITNIIQAFQNSKQYVIPSYQRNYVWTRESQWEPLWEDVKALADRQIKDGGETEPHFLGTIITKVIGMGDGHVSRSWVVDGQQRLTTLQIMLAAARTAFLQRGLEQLAGVLLGSLVNDQTLVVQPKDRYKIDHKGGDGLGAADGSGDQHGDYARFTSIIAAAVSPNGAPVANDSTLSECYAYYGDAVNNWLPAGAERDAEPFAKALSKVMREKLRVVDIRLGQSENPHAIFEALNARGEPLTEWEKTKNYILSVATCPEDPDGDGAYRSHLRRYDVDPYWNEIVSIPRFRGKRIDLFLFYFCQIELPPHRREIAGETKYRPLRRDSLYRDFRYVGEHHYRRDRERLNKMLERLGKYADIYRSIDRHDGYSPYARAVMRRWNVLNLNSLVPVFMVLVKKLGRETALDRVLRIVDSYLMRRVALKARYSGFDDIAFGHVQALRDAATDQIAKILLDRFLRSRWPDRWPGDDEIRRHFVNGNMYEGISSARLRLLLGRIAREMHEEKHPKPPMPFGLDPSVNIEHVAPQHWERHWQDDLGVGTSEEERWRLRQIVHRIGNLTLVTLPMNNMLGNNPWSFKVDLLGEDLLEMNRRLLGDMDGQVWNEAEIERRGRQLAEYVARIWPHAASLAKELGIPMVEKPEPEPLPPPPTKHDRYEQFWKHYVQRYPEDGLKTPYRASNQWVIRGRGNPWISVMFATGEVGMFLTRWQAVKEGRKAWIASRHEVIDRELGVGGVQYHSQQFDTHNPANWDAMCDWLHERLGRFLRIVETDPDGGGTR